MRLTLWQMHKYNYMIPTVPLKTFFLQVLLLKRKAGLYASYDWFSEFCGSEGDGKNLMSFAATASLQYTTILPDQKDEFAPVRKN